MKPGSHFFIFLALPLISYGQETNTDNEDYLKNDRNKISLVAEATYLTNSFGLLYEKRVFRLKPNDSFYTELLLRYRWLDANISFTPKLIKINDDNDIKGKTKYFNLGFAFFVSPKIRQSVSYTQVKGLYLDKTKEFLELIFSEDMQNVNVSNAYLQYPDARYQSFRGGTSYLWLGDKINYRSYTNMTYKPLKNDFVLLTGLFYQYSILKDSDKVSYEGVVLEDAADVSSTKDITVALRSGAGIQRLIQKDWYAIIELYPQLYYSKLLGENFHEFNIGMNSNVRLGYDNGKWFFGGGAQLNWVNNGNENFYSTTQWQFRFGVGLRINSPKFVGKTFDKVDNILK
ncbi:DUF4421 family protein [Chryseobacterium sp. CT-SW4]|uniref:DUF4421 family protein n=1 Tax=Chryseobacterium sp. SW-1 TaxID=3157343 RepID=UPI003B0172FB